MCFGPWHGTLDSSHSLVIAWSELHVSTIHSTVLKREKKVAEKFLNHYLLIVSFCSFFLARKIKRTNEGGNVEKYKKERNEQKWLTPEESITRNRSDHYHRKENSYVPFRVVYCDLCALKVKEFYQKLRDETKKSCRLSRTTKIVWDLIHAKLFTMVP